MKTSPKVNLSLETEEIEITPQMRRAGVMVLLQYEDSGVGLEEQVGQVFLAMLKARVKEARMEEQL
jgi:hypothetical protein